MPTKKTAIEIFLDISVYLTGFEKIDLLGTGMTEAYYDALDEKYGHKPGLLESFFKTAKSILTENDTNAINAQIADKLLNDKFNDLSNNIISVWYMGALLDTSQGFANYHNISSQSYVQGLIWSTADAHPPGAKQPGYGSWNLDPDGNKHPNDRN